MKANKDYGCDPLGEIDGEFRFKMVPSGDIVNQAEKEKRLARFRQPARNGCMGLSWEEIAMKQGGLQTLDITRKNSR